jgi:hypothetical protein
MLARADRGHAELAAERFRGLRTGGLESVEHAERASMLHEWRIPSARSFEKYLLF